MKWVSFGTEKGQIKNEEPQGWAHNYLNDK